MRSKSRGIIDAVSVEYTEVPRMREEVAEKVAFRTLLKKGQMQGWPRENNKRLFATPLRR
jgi:hypothetical protein